MKSPRTQARVDLTLFVIFYFPAVFAMVFTGAAYSFESARILESSVNSPAGVPVWPLKLVIFVGGITLLIAGIAEVLRCLVCACATAAGRRGAVTWKSWR